MNWQWVTRFPSISLSHGLLVDLDELLTEPKESKIIKAIPKTHTSGSPIHQETDMANSGVGTSGPDKRKRDRRKRCLDAEINSNGLKFAEKWGVAFERVRYENLGKKTLRGGDPKGRPTIELLARRCRSSSLRYTCPRPCAGNSNLIRAAHPQRATFRRRGRGLHGEWRAQFQHHLGPSAAPHAEPRLIVIERPKD